MKVTLRTKQLKDGSQSLYLDVYENGKRRYEYLRLYLIPEVDDDAKRLNKNALKKANELKSKYILGQRNPFQEKEEETFVTMQEWLTEYSRRINEERKVSNAPRQQTKRVVGLLESYLCSIKKKNIRLSEFGKAEAKGFLKYLSEYHGERVERFSKSTLAVYQQRIVAIFNAAVRDGLITKNPFGLLTKEERFKKPYLIKEVLSVEEVKKIAATKIGNNQVRIGFLFACFTGLKLSDIRSLKWSDIVDMGTYKAIIKEQKKTKNQVVVPLCNTALLFLPEQQNDDFVFHLPKWHSGVRDALKIIAKAAGIKKNVGFHTSRRTFATLTLSVCNNLKQVSVLLGHKSIENTQRYAEVMLADKADAVNRMDSVSLQR